MCGGAAPKQLSNGSFCHYDTTVPGMLKPAEDSYNFVKAATKKAATAEA